MTEQPPDHPVTASAPLAASQSGSTVKALLFASTSSVFQQFARYILVGGVAFAVDFGSLYALTEYARFHYLAAAAIAFLLGLITNYLLSRVWVFNQRAVQNVAAEFIIFAIIGVVGLGMNEAILWILSGRFHFHYLAAKVISAAAILFWNFGARRALLFSSASPLLRSVRNPTAMCGSLGLALGYLAFCLFCQSSNGAWTSCFVMHPDEPSHFVGSVMVRDWLVSGQWHSPIAFAQNYYNHYPFFAIGYWPPLFPATTALWFLLAGVGRIQALVVSAACATATAWLLFWFLRKAAGAVVAACVGMVFLSLPVVQIYYCVVMVDHMTTCLTLAGAALVLCYLRHPGYKYAFLSAVACALAILSKYSAAYLVVLPFLGALILGRKTLLFKLSLLIQPVILASIVGPWFFWTRHLTYYGLPSTPSHLSLGRIGLCIGRSFTLFPVELMVCVALGLLALLIFPTPSKEIVYLLGTLLVVHWTFLIVSPIGFERRYLMLPAACLLALAAIGWFAALSRWHSAVQYAPIAAVALVVAVAVFTISQFGHFRRPLSYPIQAVVNSVLKRPLNSEWRIVVPSDLEGPFVASFITHESSRPRGRLLRPSKTLAKMDWFGGSYRSLFGSPGQMMAFFEKNPVDLIVWHHQSGRPLLEHEQTLQEMLRLYPQAWRKQESFLDADGAASWAIYAQMTN
jgi:putative flippase GtrA